MKVTLNWLKQYVDFSWTPEELSERLTMIGIEVEGVQKLGGEFEGVVVAQVITRDKHPNADKLSLCRVNDGKGERQIVCGANNFKVGDKVPLILPGSSLPANPGEPPFTIKIGKIRGVESHGMMCSPQELGLPDKVDGLLILREEAKVGQPFAEYLGRSGSDVVYDLEITPNRPDLNSVIGIAREISAVTGNPLTLPQIPQPPRLHSKNAAELVAVRLEDANLCPRYTARVICGIKVAPSPEWLKNALEKVGMRSINNVVDVTNFVMLESGQPLHAFDYHLLARGADAGHPRIVVRRAHDGEPFETLDGQKRALGNQMLLIADETKPVALAGIMGGQNSEISLSTTDVLLESACFSPQNIRATSKQLDVRTESSYRFERGADIGICDWASRRAAALIQETAGGTMCGGVVDAYPVPCEPKRITLRPSVTNLLLGIDVPADAQVSFLRRLGLETVSVSNTGSEIAEREPESMAFRVPSFRLDLKREIDLVEEIARMYGIDRIPATPPRGALGSNSFDLVHDQIGEARQILTGLGLCEAQGQTLISDTAARLVNESGFVPLGNPLSSAMNVLRPGLLPGLVEALRHNLSHKNNDVALFEIGRVFAPGRSAAPAAKSPSTSLANAKEERHLAIALTGVRNPLFWSGGDRGATFDLYDLKGILEEFLDQFGVRGFMISRDSAPSGLFFESGSIQLGKFCLGQLGQLRPNLAKSYDLRDAVFIAEVNLDLLLARRNTTKAFKPFPTLPSIRRDIAMIVPESISHEHVLQVIKQAKPLNLESIEIFDVFRGKNIPDGQKSVAYALTYRSKDRNLTDAEVNANQEKLVSQLKTVLKAVVRET
jgi:phenylalanyl-tRNA synthetase beta chain